MLGRKRSKREDSKKPVLEARKGRRGEQVEGAAGLGRDGHDLQAQLLGLALQVLDGALAVLLFVEICAGVDVFGLVSEHGIDDAGQLVSGSGDGSRGVGASFDAAVEGAEIRVAVREALSGHSEGLGGTILRFLGAGLGDLTAGDVVVGTDGEPGREVLAGFPKDRDIRGVV